MTTSFSWLESSLHRSSKLGLEVLERARKRSVPWSSDRPSDSRTSSPEAGGQTHLSDETQHSHGSPHENLHSAFGRIVEYMDHTSYECKKFYKSAPEPSSRETEHICYFHSKREPQLGPLLPSTSRGKHAATGRPVAVRDSSRIVSVELQPQPPEDFHIELSPGSYAITAGMQGLAPQTHVVQVQPGQSKNLIFNL